MRVYPLPPSPGTVLFQFARAFSIGVLCLTTAVVAIVAVYVVKSKLGINLLPGPSPLHSVFVAMREAGLV